MDPTVLSDAFDLGRPLRLSAPVARGELGEIRRLETDRGTWAVKREFERGNEAANEASTAYHRLCWEAGVPTPEPIPAVTGSFVAEVSGEQVRAYTWVDLEDPDTGLDPTTVGEMLATLHAVRHGARGQVHEWHEAPVAAHEWKKVLTASRAGGAPHADRLAELLPSIIEVESILTPMAGAQTCHRDLWSDNLRRTTGGELSVIDFDNSGPADPTREAAMVVYEFGLGDDARRRIVYDAYCHAGGPGRVTGRDSFAMTVAQLHHIGHRHLRMWLASGNGDARERAMAGIEEFLGRPLLLPDVDRLVAALV